MRREYIEKNHMVVYINTYGSIYKYIFSFFKFIIRHFVFVGGKMETNYFKPNFSIKFIELNREKATLDDDEKSYKINIF